MSHALAASPGKSPFAETADSYTPSSSEPRDTSSEKDVTTVAPAKPTSSDQDTASTSSESSPLIVTGESRFQDQIFAITNARNAGDVLGLRYLERTTRWPAKKVALYAQEKAVAHHALKQGLLDHEVEQFENELYTRKLYATWVRVVTANVMVLFGFKHWQIAETLGIDRSNIYHYVNVYRDPVDYDFFQTAKSIWLDIFEQSWAE